MNSSESQKTGLFRRYLPFITPVVLATEVVLVWSGVINLRSAIVVFLFFELALCTIVGFSVLTVIREYRHQRSINTNFWMAIENGLSRVMPARLAKFVVFEPRLWFCIPIWIMGVRQGQNGHAFSYARGIRGLFWAIFGFTIVESVVLELVLRIIDIGNWIWLVRSINIYALVWLLGLWASLQVNRHTIMSDTVNLHDGIFGNLEIWFTEISEVRRVDRPQGFGGRSGIVLNHEDASVVLCYGSSTSVDLYLKDGAEVLVGSSTCKNLNRISISVDDPNIFVASLSRRMESSSG